MDPMKEELRYTDRDVKDDPRLYQLACAYLEEYTGDFEPLVEAQQYVRQYSVLTVAITRKVLNCMRHDVRVAGQLPRPQRPALVLVPDDDRPAPRVRKPAPPWHLDCDEADPHRPHQWCDSEDAPHACAGVKTGLVSAVERPVTVRHPYVIGKHGYKTHISTGTGVALWMRSEYVKDAPLRPVSFRANVLCTVSSLTDPILAAESDMPGLRRLKASELTLCKRCKALNGDC